MPGPGHGVSLGQVDSGDSVTTTWQVRKAMDIYVLIREN